MCREFVIVAKMNVGHIGGRDTGSITEFGRVEFVSVGCGGDIAWIGRAVIDG